MTTVDVNDIISLRSLNYSWTKISELLDISRSTLYRRLNDAGISTDDRTDISSSELDKTVSDIKQDFPNDGEVLLKSHLLQKGIKVTRQELRNSIHRVDHENTIARRSKTIKRRIYMAEHPNAVWHMDSHHKLIKWRFVTHAAIDGFSRTITYIKCTNNNKSTTVLEQFMCGVSAFGIPMRIRSDHGGENIKVWEYMLATYNNDISRIITGSSTHNERIERLWRDVHRSVTINYADTFRSLESESILDALNEVDIYCLHYIYLPRICKSLSDFQTTWNNHPLSTEGSKTPYQLFYEGLSCHLSEFEDNSSQFVPPLTQSLLDELNDPVTVPTNTFKPCSTLLADLEQVDPLASSHKHGKELYKAVITLCGQHLQTGCSNCEN